MGAIAPHPRGLGQSIVAKRSRVGDAALLFQLQIVAEGAGPPAAP